MSDAADASVLEQGRFNVTRSTLAAAGDMVTAAAVRLKDEQLASARPRKESVAVKKPGSVEVNHKFGASTATLSFLYREAYTRGIEEIALDLEHEMRDEWAGRECTWTHWTGDKTSTRAEYEYVLGAARSERSVQQTPHQAASARCHPEVTP